METLVIETAGRLMFTNAARVVRAGVEVSVDLAAASNFEAEKANPFIKWIVGDFVEADNANSNTQFWTKDDLAMGEYSIKYSPLNMLHKQQTPVGFFASTQTIDLTDGASLQDDALAKPKKHKHRYIHPSQVHKTMVVYGGSNACVACGQPASDPDHDGDVDAPGAPDTDAAAANGSAKIEALAGMWSHVFPFESALVDQADELGQLFYSMECRGTHLHCAGPNGCDKTFDYMAVDTHCQHLMERSSIRHIVNPTFRGGALIIPPTKPGWKGASASVIQEAVREEAARYAEQTEAAFNAHNAAGGDLSASQWEHLMATVVTLGQR
jgi:hypothetical protein